MIIARPRPRPGRTHVVLALMVVGVLAVLGLAAYREQYERWPWSTQPTRLQLCGRDFEPEGAIESHARITGLGYHLVRVGEVPGWFDTAAVWRADDYRGSAMAPLPGGCGVVMYVQTGADSYRTYVLEGGP